MSWISPRVIRGNRGDIASRYCILSELIAAGVDVNAVFATRPEHVPSALRGRLVSYGPIYNLWPRLEGLRAFFRSRYVVWTGGLDLQDDSSLVKLVHMWIVFASYRALGLRILLAMQGAGPLTTPTGRWLARRVLALVDAALLRDRGSFELVAGLAKQEKLVLAHDGIFLSGLSADGEEDLEQRPSLEAKLRIGLNLRLWFHFANSWIPYQFARDTYRARAEEPMSRIVDYAGGVDPPPASGAQCRNRAAFNVRARYRAMGRRSAAARQAEGRCSQKTTASSCFAMMSRSRVSLVRLDGSI